MALQALYAPIAAQEWVDFRKAGYRAARSMVGSRQTLACQTAITILKSPGQILTCRVVPVHVQILAAGAVFILTSI